MKLTPSPEVAAQQWPADRVERRLVADLVPYARNARTHSPEQIKALSASMSQWGFTNPVLVDEVGGIIAGHGRVLAAQALGWPEVPVMVAAGWTEAQKRAYVIADNQLAIGGASWDSDLLAVELDELRDLKFDVNLMGFTRQELNDLIGMPNTGPDTSPQLTDGFKFSVIIGAKDEADQARLLERFEAEGLQCRPLITQ